MLIVFDLDGVLAAKNDEIAANFRAPDFEEQWVEAARNGDYAVNENLASLAIDLIRQGHDVRVWTARPERIRRETAEWLLERGIEPNELRMAPDDYRGTDTDLKRDWAKAWLPHMAYEDSADICHAYRELGVNAIYVKPWW